MLYLRSSVRGQINHNLFIKKESKLDIASSNKYLMNFLFFCSGCRDGGLAGSLGRELRVLLLLEHSVQRGVLGAATLSG